MKTQFIAICAGVMLAANATGAINVDRDLTRSMDDVQSLGVVYINHHSNDGNEADYYIERAVSVTSVTENAH